MTRHPPPTLRPVKKPTRLCLPAALLPGILALVFALSRPFVLEPEQLPAAPGVTLAPTVRTSPAPGLKPVSVKALRAAVANAINRNFQQFPPLAGESRHDLNRRLQADYHGAELVVFAFEGTAEYEPRMNVVMQQAAKALRTQGLSTQGSEMTLQYATYKGLSQAMGHNPNWSGLLTGPLESLLQDPELEAKTQWFSFPSEEYEALSRITTLQAIPLQQIFSLILAASHTPGIDQALATLRKVQTQARSQGKAIQMVIVTHSSGIRSALKFIELADQHVPLLVSIDPVPEAQLALGEVYRQVQRHMTEQALNQVISWLDVLPLTDLPRLQLHPPLLRQGLLPDSLVKPAHVSSLINFYQQQDTQGLRMQPQFGIHGSPIAGADNYKIHTVGTRGHSEISYAPEVCRAFVDQLKQLVAKF